MPLDHSLEGQLAYNRRRSVWPPPDLQIDSGKLVRKTGRALSNVAQRIGLKDSLRSTKPKPTVLSQEREPLSLKPRRALTIKDNTTENHELAVSPLFRLPLGIRQTIYKHVLGNSNIHIVSIRGGQELRHLRCNCATCPGFAFYIERGKWKREWICNDYNYDSGPKNLYTNLLRTCRQVYSEAIELLYSSNVFSFKDPKVLQNFVAWTLPSRHSGITTVHVDLHIPQQRNIGQGTKENNPNHELNPWDNAWGALGTLPCLQHIQIRVHPIESARPGSPNLLERVEALGKSQSLRTCRFYLPEEFEPKIWMSEAPFEVVALDEWEWDHNFTRRPLTVF